MEIWKFKDVSIKQNISGGRYSVDALITFHNGDFATASEYIKIWTLYESLILLNIQCIDTISSLTTLQNGDIVSGSYRQLNEND